MINYSKIFSIIVVALLVAACETSPATEKSALEAKAKSLVKDDRPCLEVSLTGTLGGPGISGNLAGSGTLVKVGTYANDCGDIHLQFDTGRATGVRLAELGVNVNQLNAVFITHLHSDHTVGLIDIAQTRWHFLGKPFDLVCSGDHITPEPHSRVMSCREFGKNITAAAEAAGEIAQRSAENKKRTALGPSSIINFIEVATPLPTTPEVIWTAGDVTVSAIGSKPYSRAFVIQSRFPSWFGCDWWRCRE